MARTKPASLMSDLSLQFQGLCALIRDTPRMEDATEVCVLLLRPPRLESGPKLCRHFPVMSLVQEDQEALPEKFRGEPVIIPGRRGVTKDRQRPRGAMVLQTISLEGMDVRIENAPAGIRFVLGNGPDNCRSIIEPGALSGNGAVARKYCEKKIPPKLVAARVFLSGGVISVTGLSELRGWLLSEFGEKTPTGNPIVFAQEFTFRLRKRTAQFEALVIRPFGKTRTHTVALKSGQPVSVGICNLCRVSDDLFDEEDRVPRSGDPTDDGWDALSHYELLPRPPKVGKRIIPRRELDDVGLPEVTVNQDGCAPSGGYRG